MKVGVLIVTHYRLGEEFLQALRLILPEAPTFEAVSVDRCLLARPGGLDRHRFAASDVKIAGRVRVISASGADDPVLARRQLDDIGSGAGGAAADRRVGVGGADCFPK